jgi:hypothetical protein
VSAVPARASEVAISFNAPPTLGRFFLSEAFVRACIGPIGSGKSSACLLEILRRAVEQRPWGEKKVRSSRFAVIRNTYRELKDTTRKTFEQWLGPCGRWVETDFTFIIDAPMSDGTRVHCEVLFRALDKPGDVKKVLSLELTGAYINEMREVPKVILDGIQGRVGRYPAVKDGGCTWRGVWGDSNPWETTHWGYELFTENLPASFALFEQPDALGPDAENIENLDPGYYERLTAGKDEEWIDEYVRGKYPNRTRGSIYGDLVSKLFNRGGMLPFEHPTDFIFTVWDLGFTDATAIWFWRLRWVKAVYEVETERLVKAAHWAVDIVDHYDNHGEPLSHYFEVLDRKAAELGYQYARHYLPHDARARTLQTGRSIVDQFIEKYMADDVPAAQRVEVEIGPELALQDGITAGRHLLEQDTRIHPRCVEGLKALRAYRRKYDEAKKAYSRTPVHDWSSHTADAFRYLACAVQAVEALMTKPANAEQAPAAVPADGSFNLDELYEAEQDTTSADRRI